MFNDIIAFTAQYLPFLEGTVTTFTEIITLIIDYWPYFLRGTRNTLVISFAGVIGGCLLGLLITALRMSSSKSLSLLGKAFIAVFRGVPLIVQLWIGYFQLSDIIPFPDGLFLGMDLSRLLPCLIILSLNSAAYIAEILRSGIQAVDKGQMEAARSIGMTNMIAMKEIILPQAIKNVLPAICGEFVTLIKETAIIQYLGIADLMYSMSSVKSMTFKILPSYYIVGVIYFIINYFATKGVEYIERRMQRNDKN